MSGFCCSLPTCHQRLQSRPVPPKPLPMKLSPSDPDDPSTAVAVRCTAGPEARRIVAPHLAEPQTGSHRGGHRALLYQHQSTTAEPSESYAWHLSKPAGGLSQPLASSLPRTMMCCIAKVASVPGAFQRRTCIRCRISDHVSACLIEHREEQQHLYASAEAPKMAPKNAFLVVCDTIAVPPLPGIIPRVRDRNPG